MHGFEGLFCTKLQSTVKQTSRSVFFKLGLLLVNRKCVMREINLGIVSVNPLPKA